MLLLACVPARADLLQDVEYLSSPLLKGRGPGSTGAVETYWFIARRFRKLGLETSLQSFQTEKGVARNIIGIHRGNPKSKSYTLVMAHYDGLNPYEGEIYPGADSNASGVAVMLSLAEELSTAPANYIFVGLDAHNAALEGAEKLATLPWNLNLVVNIDIIGSTLAPPNKYRTDFLIALGGEKLDKTFTRPNFGPGLRIYFNYYGSKSFTEYFYEKASDQAPFLRKKIPALMFTSGITMNTNKPSDTFETLDLPVLVRRRDLILAWLLQREGLLP